MAWWAKSKEGVPPQFGLPAPNWAFVTYCVATQTQEIDSDIRCQQFLFFLTIYLIDYLLQHYGKLWESPEALRYDIIAINKYLRYILQFITFFNCRLVPKGNLFNMCFIYWGVSVAHRIEHAPHRVKPSGAAAWVGIRLVAIYCMSSLFSLPDFPVCI